MGKVGQEMKTFTVDFEAWTRLEARNIEEAYAMAQGIINEIEKLVSDFGTMTEPLELLVKENGITEQN